MRYQGNHIVKLIVALITITTIVSCRKDKVVALDNIDLCTYDCDCAPIPSIEGYNMGYSYILDTTFYQWAQFNPSNDNEIIYCEYSTQGNRTINKLNIVTLQKEIIYEGMVWSSPEWGKQDWILFTHADGNVYKIRSDGSDLSTVTSGGAYFHPKFNEEGDRFVATHSFVDISEYYPGVIWDLNGNLIDTFFYGTSTGDWRKQDYLATRSGSVLHVIDPYTNESLSEFEWNNNDQISDFVWLNQDEGMFTSGQGVFKLNVWTKQFERVLCGCSSRFYNDGSVNSDGSKILYTQINLKLINPTTLLSSSELILMNPDGSDIEHIIIP